MKLMTYSDFIPAVLLRGFLCTYLQKWYNEQVYVITKTLAKKQRSLTGES